MLLTTIQVQNIFNTHQEKVSAILSKLPELNTQENCEYIDNILALIYKNILDADPHPIIFNIPFSLCLEEASPVATDRNIAEFKKIMPLYLTYKDAGYANLELLKDTEQVNSQDLLVFKLLGNIRAALANENNIKEEMSNTIYCALFLYLLNLEKDQQIDNKHLTSLAKYASQLCSVYLHPDGISLLLARREGIACSIDPTNKMRDFVVELLTQTMVIASLYEDECLAQNTESKILDKIAEEEARLKRIEARRQQLTKLSEKTISDLGTQVTSVTNSVATQLAQNKSAIEQQRTTNLANIDRRHENMLHDIRFSSGGGMFSMPGVNAPLPSATLGIGLNLGPKGPDLIGTHTYQTPQGLQTTSFSLREAQIVDMQASIQRAQQINSWWNNQVTHAGRDSYVQRTYVPSTLVQSIAAPATLTPQAAPINVISPYVAALTTKNPVHLEAEKQATASIDKDIKSVGSIIRDVLQGDASVGEKVKAVIKAVADGDYSSVEKRMLERDKMQQDLRTQRGEKSESSQATIAVSAFSTAAKNIVSDAVQVVKGLTSAMGDAYLMGNADPKLHEAATARMKQRTDTMGSAVKEVVTNPSIITDSIAARAKSNMDGYSKAADTGQLWDAGKAVGEELYDVYNISSLAIGLGAGAVSASKLGKKIYQTHDFQSPILVQFQMGRLNSGIPIDSIKLQKPLVKKAGATETGVSLKTNPDGGVTWQGLELGKGVKAYEGKALGGVDPRYIADQRLVLEVPFIGKGHPLANSDGFLRDLRVYWKEILNRIPEAFSEANKYQISKNRAPKADHVFVKIFPQYNTPDLLDTLLIHHHIGGGREVVGMPVPLHPGFGGVHVAEKILGVQGIDSEVSEVLQRLLVRSTI